MLALKNKTHPVQKCKSHWSIWASPLTDANVALTSAYTCIQNNKSCPCMQVTPLSSYIGFSWLPRSNNCCAKQGQRGELLCFFNPMLYVGDSTATWTHWMTASVSFLLCRHIAGFISKWSFNSIPETFQVLGRMLLSHLSDHSVKQTRADSCFIVVHAMRLLATAIHSGKGKTSGSTLLDTINLGSIPPELLMQAWYWYTLQKITETHKVAIKYISCACTLMCMWT